MSSLHDRTYSGHSQSPECRLLSGRFTLHCRHIMFLAKFTKLHLSSIPNTLGYFSIYLNKIHCKTPMANSNTNKHKHVYKVNLPWTKPIPFLHFNISMTYPLWWWRCLFFRWFRLIGYWPW